MQHLWLLLLSILHLLIPFSQSAELFLATSLSVSNWTVSQVSTLSFQLFLNTQTVQSGDYLSIILPSSIQFKTTLTPSCSASPITALTCKIVSSSMANITFTSSSSSSITSFQGSISNFQNPDSIVSILTIELDLYSSAGLLKASTSTASLSNFQVATFTGSLSSSSNIVGASSVTLSVSITPSTKIKSTGIVIITVPVYYSNAGSNYMMGSTSPTCTGSNGISVTSCYFSQSSRQVTIVYSASSDITATTVFTVSSFKNPISPQTVTGFSVLTQDSLGNNIGYISTLSLSGVTVPTSFSAYQVNIEGTTSIGEYTTLQLTLSLSVPVQQYCYLKFVFPSDFTVDNYLVSLSGTGFFTASLTTSSVPWLTLNTASQTIIIEACSIYYGMNQVGQITFYQIKNPGYVKTTGSIQVYLAADSSFDYVISQVTSDFTVSASQFNPGSINSITVAPVDSYYIQTSTSYSFTFTPVHDMKSSGAQIVIVFPSTITLSIGSTCTIVSKSASFDSSSIACTIGSSKITVTSPFNNTYTGGTQLQLTLSKGTNPISVEDAGTFTITTYISVGGISYNVDSGSASNQFTPIGGWIHKGSNILASNYETYQLNAGYTFYLLFQHSVPVNGIIRILIPSEVSISSNDLIKTTCVRKDTSMSATCAVVSTTEIQVTLDSGTFPNGFPASQTLPLYMAGFQNPRTTAPTAVFQFYSTDSSGYSIDESPSSEYFSLSMSIPSSIVSVSAGMLNTVNGNVTTYIISFVPNTPLYSGDEFLIEFPSQVTLPISSSLVCNTTQTTKVSKLSCSLINSAYLQVSLSTVVTINANDQVNFNVYNVKNPISTAPSSPFSAIQLQTSTGYQISQYTSTNVVVTTSLAGTIKTYSLSQSNYNPRLNAMYTITFTTFDSLPPNAAFIVITPSSITVNSTNQTCYLQTTSIHYDVCIITSGLIQIVNSLTANSVNYVGEVAIVFQAINPEDNSNAQSIIVRSYTDSTFTYRIDKIESGLVPSLFCNYPCQTCSQDDPSYCTSCFTSDYTLPQNLQIYPNGTQTCAYSCLEGYTTNGSQNPKKCTSCDPTCSICAETGSAHDYKTCITCSKSYPFYYAPAQTCWQSCSNGTYACSQSSCCNCQLPCKNCMSDSLCTSCYEQYNTSLYLLESNQCVSSCDVGKTSVGNQCVACNSPCGTCDVGFPNSCLTCDGLTAEQFLFGRTCVETCPNGTTLDYDYRKCDGCMSQCTKCNDNDNAICLACISGLILFNDSCITQCPDNYIQSFDGSTCELRPYLLDGSLIYFPFGTAAGAFILICIMSTCISCGKSLLLTNCIALLSFVEMATVAMVFYESYKKQYVLIQFGAAGILGLQILMNTLFLIYYCCRLQYLDVTFNYWRQKYTCSMILVLVFSSVISFKAFRLIYGRLFGLNCLSALVGQHTSFFKPIIGFSMASIITFTAPVCVLGSIVIYKLTWGTQLYITVLECCGVSFISGLMMLLEHCPCCCNQYAPKEKKKLLPKEEYKKIEDASSFIQQDLDKNDLDERGERVKRADVLKNILQSVKNNKELSLNHFFDQVYDEEEMGDGEGTQGGHGNNRYLRRVQSSKELIMYKYKDGQMKGDDERKVGSYPNSPHLSSYDIPAQTLWFEQIHMKENDRDRIKHIKKMIENMKTEFKFDNVFAESKPPKPIQEPTQEKEQCHIEIQTEAPDKKSDKGSSGSSSPKSKRKTKQALDDRQAQDSMDQLEESNQSNQSRKDRKRNQQRGKRNKAYYTQIDEEDEDDNFSGDEGSMAGFKTTQDQLGVIVEDEEGDIVNIKGQPGQKLYKIDKAEEFKLLDDLPSERQTMRDTHLEQEYFNQRTFNINDIQGEYQRTAKGKIKQFQFKDDEGKDCNEQGYLIDKYSGDIISKYTFNRMFRYEEEIPLVYRLEAHNFNPHEVFGNFDYDKESEKPIILKNKQGQLVDKNLRNVNAAGYLVDSKGNIVDNQGRVKFMKHEQTEKGDLMKLYNYKGKSYSIRDIVGVFKKNNQTKEIVIEKKKNNNKVMTDKLGRQVNQKGYLIDNLGNIINKQNKIVFRKHTLLFNEPPKFFSFTRFNISEIMGSLNYNEYDEPVIEFSPFHGGPRDLEGRLVNWKGYLIDEEGNILDQNGKLVFYKEILEDFKNDKVELPKVFRCGVLKGHQDHGEVEADQHHQSSNHQEKEKKEVVIAKQQEFTLNSPKKSIDQQQPIEVLAQDDQRQNSIKSNSFKLPRQSDNSFRSPKHKETYSYQSPKSIVSKQSAVVMHQEEVSQSNNNIFSQENNESSQFEEQAINYEAPSEFNKAQVFLSDHEIEKEEAKIDGEQEESILPKKKIKQAANNRKERLKSAYQPAKPPKQTQQRAKSSQRPSFQRLKNTTTPFDYKSAANPQGFIKQDKAKERLAKLAHSISGFNQTETFKMGSVSDLNHDRKNMRSGKTDSVQGRSGNQHMKQVMKNKYVLSYDGDSNSGGGGDNNSYNQYLDNDMDLSQSNYRKGQHKSKHIQQNDSQLDHRFYANENLSDEQISEGVYNENFNIDKQSYGQQRGIGMVGSRLDLLTQYSGESNSQKRGVDKNRKIRIESKMKALEKIYLNKLEQPKSQTSLMRNQGSQRRMFNQTSVNSLRQPMPIAILPNGFRMGNEDFGEQNKDLDDVSDEHAIGGRHKKAKLRDGWSGAARQEERV